MQWAPPTSLPSWSRWWRGLSLIRIGRQGGPCPSKRSTKASLLSPSNPPSRIQAAHATSFPTGELPSPTSSRSPSPQARSVKHLPVFILNIYLGQVSLGVNPTCSSLPISPIFIKTGCLAEGAEQGGEEGSLVTYGLLDSLEELPNIPTELLSLGKHQHIHHLLMRMHMPVNYVNARMSTGQDQQIVSSFAKLLSMYRQKTSHMCTYEHPRRNPSETFIGK